MKTELLEMTAQEIEASVEELGWENLTIHNRNIFNVYNEAIEHEVFQIETVTHAGVESSQECYLGYSPSTKTFWSAHDCWLENENEEMCFNQLQFTIHPEGCFCSISVERKECGNRMFYSTGGYDTLKQRVPDLIDLRLD